MDPLLDAFIKNGLLVDALGILGLGLIGISAIRLAQRQQSWGGTMMALGAIGLLFARFLIVTMRHLRDLNVTQYLSENTLRVTSALPSILLTLGLAGVVWGLWAHERWLRETRT